MNTNLTPLDGRYSRFNLNGQEEYIISLPKDRGGIIAITMGGKNEHSTNLLIDDFEEMTGHYVVGLEPSFEYDLELVLAQYKAMMEKNDLTVNENPEYCMMQGSINFTTDKNVHVSCYCYVRDEGDNYRVIVGKNAGSQSKREKEFSGPKSSLPLLLQNAISKVEEFTTTKVQILNMKIDNSNSVREHDQNGFAILKPNESVEDYFKLQNMPAGIVVNNANKFQAFFSKQYPGYEDRSFYETNDYKTIKGAEKFLDKFGFDKKGRFNDVIDENQFVEDFDNYKQHFLRSITSSHEGVLANIELNNGFGEVSLLKKDISEDTGCTYYVDLHFIEEKTGKRIDKRIDLRMPDDAVVNQVGNAYNEFTSHIYNGYKNGTLEFNDDNRSKQEILQYHKERFVKFNNSNISSEKSISENSDPERLREAWKDYMGKNVSLSDHHQEQYREISRELNIDNDSSLNC
jgi:hypothetical protein